MTKYQPVFVGKAKDGERICLFRDNLAGYLHIKRGDGPLQALGPDTVISHHTDPTTGNIHVEITSAQWTGKAVAQRQDMTAGVGLDLPNMTDEHITRGEN